MKTRKTIPMAVAVASIAVTGVLAMGLLNLPLDPVSATHGAWTFGTLGSTLDVTLGLVPPGFDVTNGTYPGWCIEDNHQDNFPPGTMFTLWDTSDDILSLPATYQAAAWDKVNYLLNNRAGTAADVQAAIWKLVGTDDPVNPALPWTPAAQAMYDAAMANGAGFLAGPGQVTAVILYGDGLGPGGFQDTIIEVPVPDMGQGCTPGYWRNHFEDWPPTGLNPADDFDATFGVNYFHPDITLGDAIWLGGGHVRKVARHGTAALLNVLHPDVDYPYTLQEVMDAVQAGNVDALVVANELGCGIQ